MVLVGGAMANTFVKAQGHGVGCSLVEDDMLDTARRMLELARESSTELLLPQDYVVTDNVKQPSRTAALLTISTTFTVSSEFAGSSEVVVMAIWRDSGIMEGRTGARDLLGEIVDELVRARLVGCGTACARDRPAISSNR